MNPSQPRAVIVQGVTQRFSLRHEKTLKGLLLNRVRGTHPSTESFLALDDVSLEIPTGTTVGLIGHNGSGKSTLLKIIGGVLTPTSGQVTRRGRLAALLELGAGFHRDLSGRENVFLNAELLGLSRRQIVSRFDDIVDFSGVESFIDTPMKFYSSGMFVRLGFAVAVHTDPDILLVDEVLAVGDEQFQAKCLGVIRRFQAEGRTIVLVSHSMAQVEQFCDEVTLLNRGRLAAQGQPQEVIAVYRDLLGQGRPGPDARSQPDSARAEIVDVQVRTISGRSLDEFVPGDGLVVDATYQADEEVPGFVGWVGIYFGSTLLHGTSTLRLGLGSSGFVGERRVRFVLPDLPLSGGSFRVAMTSSVAPGQPAWHALPSAAQVRVDSSAFPGGPLAVHPRAEVLSAEPGSRE